MVSPTLHLSAGEVLLALDGIDPVDLLAAELTGQGAGDRSLTPWRGRAAFGRPAERSVLLTDPATDARCVLPVAALRACRTAAVVALATRTLLGNGMVTAAVLGSGYALQAQLTVILRHLRRVGCLTVRGGAAHHGSLIEPRLLDQIDLAGIRLVVATTVEEAVFAADLVLAVGGPADRLAIGALAKGSVVVNATGRDIPGGVADSVDQLYVDDASLIERSIDRHAVRAHLGGQRPVDADLGQVLSGAHPGRTHLDHILLVELLGTETLSPALAQLLYQTAQDRRLGSQLFD